MITPSYNPDPLSPEVLIHDLAGVLQYTFQTSATQVSPTRDFNLVSLHVHNGINDDYGNAELLIEDPSNLLTDTTVRKACKIKRQWDIQIKLGKSNATLYRVFFGKVFDAEIIRPGTNLQQIRITCVGWGVRLRDRMTSIKRFQLKTSDGLTLDTTDTNTKVSELLKDLVVDIDHYPFPGLAVEAGITTTGVGDIDVKLPDLQEDFVSWASVASFLAGAGNLVYTVDADKDLYLNDPVTQDSGFLFTNDLATTNLDAQNWSSTKIGYLFNSPISFIDSSFGGAYSILHGTGGVKDTLDINVSASNATFTEHETYYIAIPVTPTKDNLSKIALKMSKTGTPAQDMVIQIIGQDGSATPEDLDIRFTKTIDKAKVQTLTATPTMTEYTMGKVIPITPLTKIFIIINKYGTAGNEINLDYTTGSGTYYRSTDGLTWTSQVGAFAIRTYHSKSIDIVLENTVAKTKYGTREKLISFESPTNEETVRQALTYMGESLGKEKRSYSNVIVSAPTDRIPLGKFCRVYDAFNSMDVKAIISGVDIDMVAGADGNLGTNKVMLSLIDFHY